MPCQYWSHLCGIECTLLPTPVCCACGAKGEVVGWALRADECIGQYQYVYGLKPFGPHRKRIDALLTVMRVSCWGCHGMGIITVEGGGSWRICYECEGTGGFWSRSTEDVDAARRAILEEYPEAAAASLQRFLGAQRAVRDLEDDFETEEDEDYDEGDSEHDSPWHHASLLLFTKALDEHLIEDPETRPHSGRVFIPQRPLSVRSALLLAIGDQEARNAALDEECYELDAVVSRFAPLACVIECEVTDSRVSGTWGLMEFTLSHRGYLYNRPDFGIGADESLPILGAWEPAHDAAARRACILTVYAREWSRYAWPPFMGQWVSADRDLLFDAMVNVLALEPDTAQYLEERLHADIGAGNLTSDILLAVAKQSGATRKEVASFLKALGERHGKFPPITEALSAEQRRILVALFVQTVEGRQA